MSDSAAGAFTLFLAAGMLCTGTINTITTKFQDLQVVKGFGDAPPSAFEHAFFQTGCMFVGEFLCLFVYRLSILPIFQSKKDEEEATPQEMSINKEAPPKKYVNPLLFWIPACCDLGGTTLLNVGLFLTYASVYQMLRGSLIIFTGILSVVFLKHRLFPHHWGGILLIVIGTLLVATSSILNNNSDGPSSGARNPLLGAILVVAAQILAAVQFVVEEKLLKNVDAAPLQVVGWEGFFGFSMTTVALFVLYWIPGKDYHSLENAPFALAQMWNSPALMAGVVGSVISIAFFNFFGISITKRVSATIRAIIDSTRTFLIWIVSLLLGWEKFSWIQLGGFVILVFGSLIANDVLKIPYYHAWYLRKAQEYADRAKQKEQDSGEKESLLKQDN